MILPQELNVEVLLRERGREMDLQVIAGSGGLGNAIGTPELHRPGLAFAGYYKVFSHDRIQILGNTELSYLLSLAVEERRRRLSRVFSFKIPCMIVTNGNEIPEDVLELANDRSIPMLRTSLPTTRLVGLLNTYLERIYAPSVNVHGVLLDVFGMGALIMGRSGVGKSESALELIERGHRLVADDMVILRRITKEELLGRSPEHTRYHMEIRGLGILNVEKLFGIACVVEEKRVDLIVRLERWDDAVEYERLGIDDRYYTIFDVQVPEFIVPVQPGRNTSLMVEMAALNQRLKNTGFNAARELDEKILTMMNRSATPPLKSAPFVDIPIRKD